MAQFSTRRSLDLLRKTAPFLLFRAAVYFGIAVAYVLATGTGAGIGWIFGAFGDAETRASTTFWGGALGFGLTAGVLYFLREYTLYIVKAGHIAVMVEAMDGRPLPQGKDQIAFAREAVTARFGQASVLFGIDQLVKGVLRAATGLVGGLLTLLPIPGVDRIAGAVHAYLKIAVGLMDEVILAHAMRTRGENPYASAREALVLYAQNAQPLLIAAAWLTAITWVLGFVIFLVMLAPAAFVVWLLPGTISAGGFVFAILFAWAVKMAILEPFAIACMLQAYFAAIEGQEPKPDWIAKLDTVSTKFRRLSEKAAGWVWQEGSAGGAAQGPKPPA